MKKFLLLQVAIVTFVVSNASTSPSQPVFRNENLLATEPSINANLIFLPVGSTGKMISLMELSRIHVKEFEALSEQKLGLFDKLTFKLAQRKLRKKLEADGTIKSEALVNYLNKPDAERKRGFHAGGFFLGFFLSIIGVLIAYLIKDEHKRRRVTWAWIGFAIIAAPVLFLAIAYSGVRYG